MNVTVETRNRTKPLQIRQRLLAIVGAPSPVRVHGPQRNVGEYDNWRAARESLDALLQPFELFVAGRAQPAGFEVHDVDETDEVDAAVIEAVPPGPLRLF